MCIACELGYWAMVDALEAERAARGESASVKEAGFVCDAPTQPPERQSGGTVTDEQTP
jgi:hypothetical protein